MLKLDQATVTEVLSAFQKTFNSDVIDVFTGLAGVLKEEEASGGNNVVTQAYEACKKFQTQYNICLESFKGFLKDGEAVAEIADYVKKVSMGEVGNHDTSFGNAGIDKDAVLM